MPQIWFFASSIMIVKIQKELIYFQQQQQSMRTVLYI